MVFYPRMKKFLLVLLVFFTSGLLFSGPAKAQPLTPLQDHYLELKTKYATIFNQLIDTGLVMEDQIYACLVDLESELSKKVLNQSNYDGIFYNTALTVIKRHDAVYQAAQKAFGDKIPPEAGGLYADLKRILLSSIVVALPLPGVYTGSLEVTLAGFTQGASFFYTLDGSLPSPAGLAYTGPVKFWPPDSPVWLQAIAWKNGIASDVASFYYEIRCVNPCGIKGYVFLEKINPQDAEPDHTGTEITVNRKGAMVASALSPKDGFYEITGLSPGSYDVLYSHPGAAWKDYVLPVTIDGCELVQMPALTLYLGDMNKDREINILDLLWMASQMGITPDQPQWEGAKKADVNKDEKIDILDLLRVAKNIGL